MLYLHIFHLWVMWTYVFFLYFSSALFDWNFTWYEAQLFQKKTLCVINTKFYVVHVHMDFYLFETTFYEIWIVYVYYNNCCIDIFFEFFKKCFEQNIQLTCIQLLKIMSWELNHLYKCSSSSYRWEQKLIISNDFI